MKSIPVHMFAFNEDRGVIRSVDIDITTNDDLGSYEGIELNTILALVFRFGQNDFQPKHCYSVSVGDVAQLGNRYFMCMFVGWNELSKVEFEGLQLPTSYYAFKKGCKIA